MRMKEYNIWMVEAPQDCAWSWRKLLGLRRLVKDHMVIQLGDGRQCSLFYDVLDDRGIDSSVWGTTLKVSDW